MACKIFALLMILIRPVLAPAALAARVDNLGASEALLSRHFGIMEKV